MDSFFDLRGLTGPDFFGSPRFGLRRYDMPSMHAGGCRLQMARVKTIWTLLSPVFSFLATDVPDQRQPRGIADFELVSLQGSKW